MNLAEDRKNWQAFVDTVTNNRIPYNVDNFLTNGYCIV